VERKLKSDEVEQIWGTWEEVLSRAILKADPMTLVAIEADDGERIVVFVSHWLEA